LVRLEHKALGVQKEKTEKRDKKEIKGKLVSKELKVQKENKEKRVKKAIGAIKDWLVHKVCKAFKACKEKKDYPVKMELMVKLDLKAPWDRKVRVEKKEIKVIEDLWALKVLLDQKVK
jgi:hypothetical protein